MGGEAKQAWASSNIFPKPVTGLNVFELGWMLYRTGLPAGVLVPCALPLRGGSGAAALQPR